MTEKQFAIGFIISFFVIGALFAILITRYKNKAINQYGSPKFPIEFKKILGQDINIVNTHLSKLISNKDISLETVYDYKIRTDSPLTMVNIVSAHLSKSIPNKDISPETVYDYKIRTDSPLGMWDITIEHRNDIVVGYMYMFTSPKSKYLTVHDADYIRDSVHVKKSILASKG